MMFSYIIVSLYYHYIIWTRTQKTRRQGVKYQGGIMMIWHNILHSYYHSDCKSVDDKEALWSYEREEGKTQTQERFIGPIRESQLARGSILHNFFAFTTQTFGFFRICLRFQVKHYSRHRQNRTFKINLKNVRQGKNKELFLISTLSSGSAGPLSIGGAI